METEIDWNDAWKRRQRERRRADDAAYWNERAHSFSNKAGSSPYAKTFLERSGAIEAASDNGHLTVFDMGCGSGTLALPLAKLGIEVHACDFSQNMLDLMMSRAQVEGVEDRVHPCLLAWDEDWSKRDLPVCDFAFASRSIATSDLRRALEKLSSRAEHRVCITLGTDSSPRTDEILLRAVGRKPFKYPDFIYAMNILWQMGELPNLSYISSARPSRFKSPAHAVDKTCEIIGASPEERTRLEAYTAKHLVKTTDEDGRACWTYDHRRITSWAFISWDK